MAASTFEIPPVDWATELTAFSTMHQRWLVSIETLSSTLAAQPQITEMPLTGITFEPRDSGVIVIAVARAVDAHVTHLIQAPTRLCIERTASGADAALEIESADGTRTRVRFKAAALPETVDGLADWP